MNMHPASERIEYVGQAGVTQTCIDALLRFLQFDRPIEEARVLSCDQRHAFLLYTRERFDTIIVRAGFGSGYLGEGSKGFSYALSLLEEYGIETEELEVPARIFERLNQAKLTDKDVETINQLAPVRPYRILGYKYDYCGDREYLNRSMPLPIPLRLVDTRIRDLAVSFWKDPDARLQAGYRRLEDEVRSRCGLEEHGARLFRRAFQDRDSPLEWPDLHKGEHAARTDLFKATYGSFRNPRAHKEKEQSEEDLLSEFLVLNQLFRLESEAAVRSASEAP